MAYLFIRLLLLCLWMAAAMVAGHLMAGPTGAVLATMLAAVLCYVHHAWQGHQLAQWLTHFNPDNAPHLSGWWDNLAAQLFKHLRLTQRQHQALSNTLSSFRTAAQALPDGVITLDAQGHINWCNATAQTHLDLNISTDLGQPLVNLVRTPSFVNYLHGMVWDKPLTMRSPRNAQRILSIQVVGYGEQQLLVLTRDITQLEKLERMRQDFIANVSHELKTPLTVLSGFLETIRDLPLTEAQRQEYLGLMHTQAQHMQHLVEDLLALSALESSNQSSPTQEPVDFSGLSQQVLADARNLSANKHEIEGDIEKNLVGTGNAREIFSAFSNVASNAVRYTPASGRIALRLYRGSNKAGQACVFFTVQDTGIGIAAEHIPRLTERFYRVDRSRSRESGGTGLGLAIVKHVVQRHHGELTIESRPNAGSRFIIELPL